MVAALYPGDNNCKAFVDFSALPPATRVQLRNSGVDLVDTSGSTSDGSPVVVDLFGSVAAHARRPWPWRSPAGARRSFRG